MRCSSLPTVGEIAHRLGQPIHRIDYIIRTRELQPIGWAGNARIFADEDVALVARELRRIDEMRVVDVGRAS